MALQSGQQQRELVAAEPCHEISGAQLLAPGGSRLAQQAIAGRVPVGVVELLEVVEVEHRDRHVSLVGELSARCASQARRLGRPVSASVLAMSLTWLSMSLT